MVESGYRLVTECLEIDHLRLIIGSSMGGMHAWMWAEMYPNLMDAVVPILLPTGRNQWAQLDQPAGRCRSHPPRSGLEERLL
jgi:homoserine acetyltransferase